MSAPSNNADTLPDDEGSRDRGLVHATESETCCDPIWEDAYQRFETPEQEIRKFTRRLLRLGQASWSREAHVVELFCGRGNGLVALQRLGFRRLSGVDLSANLLAQYRGPATCYVADCRSLPMEDESCDIVIVQGGLHHLRTLPDDLEAVLDEVGRVLRRGGRLVIVEPWQTPFLAFVHSMCRWSGLRRHWPRLDALATMIERERPVYHTWLARPVEVLERLERCFVTERKNIAWGKLAYVGRRTGPFDAEVYDARSEAPPGQRSRRRRE